MTLIRNSDAETKDINISWNVKNIQGYLNNKDTLQNIHKQMYVFILNSILDIQLAIMQILIFWNITIVITWNIRKELCYFTWLRVSINKNCKRSNFSQLVINLLKRIFENPLFMVLFTNAPITYKLYSERAAMFRYKISNNKNASVKWMVDVIT